MFVLQPPGERLALLLDELLERGEAASHLVLQLRRLLHQALLEAGEPPVVVAHVAAEQDVAHLVQIGDARIVCAQGRLRVGRGGAARVRW